VSLVASFLLAAAVAAIVVAVRFPRARTWLVGRVTAALRVSKHVIKRPRGEPRSVVIASIRCAVTPRERTYGSTSWLTCSIQSQAGMSRGHRAQQPASSGGSG
jgi:hypothetical protein